VTFGLGDLDFLCGQKQASDPGRLTVLAAALQAIPNGQARSLGRLSQSIFNVGRSEE
jgi:hypothetical protein